MDNSIDEKSKVTWDFTRTEDIHAIQSSVVFFAEQRLNPDTEVYIQMELRGWSNYIGDMDTKHETHLILSDGDVAIATAEIDKYSYRSI